MSLSLHSGIGAPTKVVVRGTGHEGRLALTCVLDRPGLELAGDTGLGAMASLVR